MWNYKAIKQLAADTKNRIGDLLALSPSNDPFYTGRPSELEAARWFAAIWQRFGYGHGVHLRRVHYQLVSQDPPVDLPNGNGPYENTKNCWAYLNNAAKWARYLDLVPGEAFVDRRNPDALIYARFHSPEDLWYEDPTPGYSVTEPDEEYDPWEDFAIPDLPELEALPVFLPDEPNFKVQGYEGIEQAFLVEVWAEKTTMNDVLIPLCREYGVNLVTGAGELSITAVLDFLARVKKAGKPARILYVSDFDPAGLGMPISVARKIEFYLRKYHQDLDIRLEPVVLTHDQVQAYQLPRTPVKDSDRRKAGWVRDYGAGQTELDALEALHPGELRKLIRHAILQYHDYELPDKARAERKRLTQDLKAERDAIIRAHLDELIALNDEYHAILHDYDETQRQFAELVQQFQPQLDDYNERMATLREHGQAAYGKLYADLNAVDLDLDDYPLPEPALPKEPDSLLYDSNRDYLAQLAHYKAQRHNGG